MTQNIPESTVFPSDPDAFVRASDCARFCSVGVSTWWRWVNEGKVNRPQKLGPRTSVWTAGYVRKAQKELTQ